MSVVNHILIKVDNNFRANIYINKNKNKIFSLNNENPYITIKNRYKQSYY